MKKRVFIFLTLFYVLMNIAGVTSMSITPGKLEYNFEPNMELSLDFYVESPLVKIKIFASGDLAEYVTFDRMEMNGSGGFTAKIKLPAEVEKPGPNRLYIMAQQTPEEGKGIATAIAIGALVKISVPYPGKYAEMDFSVNDVNVGEDIIFNADVSSLGKEEIFAVVNTEVAVYKGKYIESFELGKDIIKPTERKSFQKRVGSDKYGAGYYNATVILDYGLPERILKIEKLFRIGSLFVNITNWTNEVYAGKVNKFDVEVESDWNNKIEHVYADVIVYNDKNNITMEFKTISESLERWEKKNLTGYLEVKDTESGIYKANITVFYENNLTSRLVEINIKRERGVVFMIIIVVASAIVLAVLILIVVLIRNKFKNKKNEKTTQKK